MSTIRVSTVLRLSLATAVAAIPLCAQTVLPDGAALLDALYEEERKGREIDEIKSVVYKGKCSIQLADPSAPAEPMKGEFEEYYQKGNYYHVSDFGGFRREEGALGDVAWEIDPMAGVVIKTGDAAAAVRRMIGMAVGEPWRKHFIEAKCAKTTTISGQLCFVVNMKPKTGKSETWYITRDTKRLAGIDLWMYTPGGESDVKVRFEEWGSVDGIAHPKKALIEVDQADVIYEYEKIEYNTPIPASRFALPKAVAKAVDKQRLATLEDDKTKIDVIELQEQPVASIRIKVRPEKIGDTLAVVIPEVLAHLMENGMRPLGHPFTRYYEFGADGIDLEAGFPVAKPIAGEGRVKPSTLPGGKVAVTWHFGHYEKLGDTHDRLQKWLAKNNIETRDARWEVYHNDPGREPDPGKWKTRVFWAIK